MELNNWGENNDEINNIGYKGKFEIGKQTMEI